eukprot:TRINITY_DN3610_c0_g1_i1.p1 TRINITY_DN3610_c0_g1~~TRINITY_DN3610_c0_g1_i1.p1  ORF type:complete len:172 (+),score=25.58 TRINITY_DN3610_c0_g1_i1:48-563(+)
MAARGDESTAADFAGYRMHHTMFRVRDPKASIDFYVNKLGMSLIKQSDFEAAKFSLYFFAYSSIPGADQDIFSYRVPVLELTHNWGTESDPEFKGYHTGNTEPRGFGHIAFIVPDVYKACERLAAAGVNVRRKPGPMQGTVHIAFVEDPDGYWVELIQDEQKQCCTDESCC